eukprot:508127-Pelagomonas_calceolata.AAC.6
MDCSFSGSLWKLPVHSKFISPAASWKGLQVDNKGLDLASCSSGLSKGTHKCTLLNFALGEAVPGA